jgi:HSP20 family protein
MTRWLIPWRGFKELDNIKKQIDDIFDIRPRRHGLEPIFEGDFTPAIDILNKQDHIIVRAEVPGVDKKDMTISISEDELTIRGEVKREQEVNGKDYYHCERTYGSFSRTIVLPATVDKNKSKASYKDGILEIALPKTETAKPKEIKLAIE